MRLKIVGQHPLSHGSECVIFGHVARRSHVFTPVRAGTSAAGAGELAAFGRWGHKPMRPSLAPQTAPALVGARAGADFCRTSGRLVVLSHSWSGKLQINNIDRKYTIDLYSAETRLVLLDLVAEIMVDVSALADFEGGALRLPDLTEEALLGALVEHRAWFRFLAPDADFRPGFWRRALGRRQPRTEAFKLQVVSRLLPDLARPAPLPLAALAPGAALRDEIRLLTAAVEGLALRAPAQA